MVPERSESGAKNFPGRYDIGFEVDTSPEREMFRLFQGGPPPVS